MAWQAQIGIYILMHRPILYRDAITWTLPVKGEREATAWRDNRHGG